MIFCEDCRLQRNWPCSPGYPFVGVVQDEKCELCHKFQSVCHNIPVLMLTPDSEKTTAEKVLDKLLQEEYHKKAEGLIITHVKGEGTGKIDFIRTEELRKIVARKNGEIDWYSTYYLRLLAQQGYQKIEERGE